MLYRAEHIPALARAKDVALASTFFGAVLLAMAGWIYLLSSVFLRFLLWCFD